MLSYALAIAVATSSLVLFLTAFLMSDIHRKDDFLWSGVGLIYALVLWYCARNITGAVLLGQAAATALLVSYSWQTLKLRRAIANPDKAAEINNFSVLQKINGLLKRDRTKVKPATPVTPKVTEQEITLPDTPIQDTVQTPASGTVEPKPEVSTAPVTDESAIEDIKTEPKLSEPKSSGIEQGKGISNVKPILSEPVEENTSTQDTEIVTQPVEPKVVVQDKGEDRSVEPVKNIEASPVPNKPEVKTKELEDTTSDRPQVADNKEIEPQPQTTDTTSDRPQVADNKDLKPQPQTTTEIPVKIKPVTKASQLDSLETVEVAEVLEAAENTTINLDTDRSNIIEVTTTEINITTEVKKLEQPEDDCDLQEK